MLYFLYGTDIDKRTRAKDALLGTRVPRRVSPTEWNVSLVDEYVKSMELFGEPFFVLIDGVTEEEKGKEILLEKAKDMAESANTFIILEKKATKEFLKKIEKAGGETHAFVTAPLSARKESPIVFTITDAFCARDKKKAWATLIEAYEQGVSPEEVAGTLFWAIKSMILASVSGSAQEADLSPYVFQKSKRASQLFTEDELQSFASSIVMLYHDAHAGTHDMKMALESFLLSVVSPRVS